MAVGDIITSWGNRLDWSGELPGAGLVLLQRFQTDAGPIGATRTFDDAASPGHLWTVRNANASSAAQSPGRWAYDLILNKSAPAAEQTSVTVPYFEGMWPSSGCVMVGIWAKLTYSMSFVPLISTRNNAGKAPLLYLSTDNAGRPRHQVYDASGTLILDQYETLPWTIVVNDWCWYGQCVDIEARTSQLATIRRATGQVFLSPPRSLSGVPNKACIADFEVATLTPTAAYWAAGDIDEPFLAHEPTGYNFAAFVERMRLGTWSRGSDNVEGIGLVVGDEGVTATSAATLQTGAQPATWTNPPDVVFSPALAGAPTAFLSADNGTTWTASSVAGLPASFTGLMRWQLPMIAGETISCIDLVAKPVQPIVDSGTLTINQGDPATVGLSGQWVGKPHFTAITPADIQVSFNGTAMTIYPIWAIGETTILVTVTDDTGLTSVGALWTITVQEPTWHPPAMYVKTPLIIGDAEGIMADVIGNPTTCVETTEVNGEHTIKFTLPYGHPRRAAIMNERNVWLDGELYQVRTVIDYRSSGVAMTDVYCQPPWYDLDVAGQADARDFEGTQAGTELAYVLENTEWTVGTVDVMTLRTWSMGEGTRLECLRAITKTHGGDLVFDCVNKTVSLVKFSGRDVGLTYVYGGTATDSKRVSDTTSLVTRIIPRNAEGIGIEDVNGGCPWLEDYTWYPKTRTAIYRFESGASPYLMLEMTTAALGARCRPSMSYEVGIIDLSATTGQALDHVSAGDIVTVVDHELGIEQTDRVVKLEYDHVQPWNSKLTLSSTLRELGSDDTSADASTLTTGADIDTRDLVPFNLLLNARFDNGLAHWASSGAVVAAGGATGLQHIEMAGGGVRWIEQTVAPDTRDVYTASFGLDTEGFPQGITPDVSVIAEFTYDDGTTETVTQQVIGNAPEPDLPTDEIDDFDV